MSYINSDEYIQRIHGRDCADAMAFDAIADDCVEFREEILPLLTAADDGDGSYEDYDLAYNEWLEAIHQGIVAHLVSTGRIDALHNRLY